MGHHIFVSYSHLDSPYVDALTKHLAGAGLTVWTDGGIEYGQEWAEVISKQIERCAALIVVVTPNSKRSPWVQREILYADLKGRPILPLLLDGEMFFSLVDRQFERITGGRMPSATFVARLAGLASTKELDLGQVPGASGVEPSASTRLSYSVDIALVVAASPSMEPFLDEVKANAMAFYHDLDHRFKEKSKQVDQLRVRVVVFRDMRTDPDLGLQQTRFMTLPKDFELFTSFVSNITAQGSTAADGSSGLEALAEAIRSPWRRITTKRRQIIVVWSDQGAYPLEQRNFAKAAAMPGSLDELTDMWEGSDYVDPGAKRLIMYVPDIYPWTLMASSWDNCLMYPAKAGAGLTEMDYSAIIDAISQSV